MVKKFIKKPIIVDAVQWNGNNEDEVMKFVSQHCFIIDNYPIKKTLIINTLEGDHVAFIGDWIVKGVKGEFYPVKPDIMEQTYTEVN